MRQSEDVRSNSTHLVCVTEIHSFLSAFLFSLETQHTIGERKLSTLTADFNGNQYCAPQAAKK